MRKPLINSKLILCVYKLGSNFIFAYEIIQFFQYHLLERLAFPLSILDLKSLFFIYYFLPLLEYRHLISELGLIILFCSSPFSISVI